MVVSIPSERESISKEKPQKSQKQRHKKVSIPSERESISKEYGDGSCSRRYCRCFNSLRTGKHIQSKTDDVDVIRAVGSFNSLRTGKHIQRFRRAWWKRKYKLFQFPPNGKAYPKSGKNISVVTQDDEFQFPPNGKAYPKTVILKLLETKHLKPRFNSLRTGKHIQRKEILMKLGERTTRKFQFPPNGKAYPKEYTVMHEERKIAMFQFPPNGKAYPKGRRHNGRRGLNGFCFNSLRTGKHIQRNNFYLTP